MAVPTLAYFGAGCGGSILPQRSAPTPKIRPWDVIIRLDPLLRGQQVVVDIIGATILETSYEALNVDDYWSENSGTRKAAAPRSFIFQGDKMSQVEISVKDPVWGIWKTRGVGQLVGVVFLPTGKPASSTSKGDPRVTLVPLDKRRYKKTQTLQLTVTQEGWRNDTPPVQ